MDEGYDVPVVKAEWKARHMNLLIRKGVYTYDYMGKFKKLKETQLPVNKDFYNRLTYRDISEDDYVHAQKVWEDIGISTLRAYHDLYLKTDGLARRRVRELPEHLHEAI